MAKEKSDRPKDGLFISQKVLDKRMEFQEFCKKEAKRLKVRFYADPFGFQIKWTFPWDEEKKK